MVEAPRIRIIYENINFTTGQHIIQATGPSYRKINIDLTLGLIKKWWFAGKYIYALITRHKIAYVIRTHMMMYGKIIVNYNNAIGAINTVNNNGINTVSSKLIPFMILTLTNGVTLSWYLSQIKILDPTCTTSMIKSNYTICSSKVAIEDSMQMMLYDISNPNFNFDSTINHIFDNRSLFDNEIIMDLLLNQEYFPGIGNILQQEGLYRCRILPTTIVNQLSNFSIICLIDNLKIVIDDLYNSYTSGQTNQYQKIFQIYHKGYCPLGHKTITKYLGYHDRRTTWCSQCQK